MSTLFAIYLEPYCDLYSLNVREARSSMRSASITPSDSVSRYTSHSDTSRSRQSIPQSNAGTHQPATRPPEYPLEILWSLEDCKTDPDVNVSKSNVSRPSMERAIRHADGNMITASEWAAIKATARMVKGDLLALPLPRDRRAKD